MCKTKDELQMWLETQCMSEWAEILGTSREKLNYRIFTAKWEVSKAFTYEL